MIPITDPGRAAIERARELVAALDGGQAREWSGEDDGDMARAACLGAAHELLHRLLQVIRQLDADLSAALAVIADTSIICVTAEQAAVIVKALADAAAYRTQEAAEDCADCETVSEGACQDHLDDLDAAQQYRGLAAELVGMLPEPDEPEDDETFICSTCGGLIGMFIGRAGWHHYSGNGTADSPVKIYDAGHEATLAADAGAEDGRL
jgi:hypothetical protein